MSAAKFDNAFRGRNEKPPSAKALGIIERAVDYSKESLLSRGWQPLVVLARTTIVNVRLDLSPRSG